VKDLAKLDDRVEAHIDGLRVAGEPGWELSKSQLGEARELFAAAVLAFESGPPGKVEEVLAATLKKPESMGGQPASPG
jgi:hypothetical protein